MWRCRPGSAGWRTQRTGRCTPSSSRFPLVGWAYSSAAGYPVVWFGVLPLPDFVSPDKALAEQIKPWHGRLAYALAALVVLHVAGAAKHQWIDRDDLLSRMRPGRASP